MFEQKWKSCRKVDESMWNMGKIFNDIYSIFLLKHGTYLKNTHSSGK